jgi:hypothetical protein
MKRIFYLLLCLTFIAASSCQSEKKEPAVVSVEDIDFSLHATHEDSVLVYTYVSSFLSAVREGHVDDAVDKLYEVDNERPEDSPIHLMGEHKQQVLDFFNRWRFCDFKIEEMTFREVLDNEVRCTLYMQDANGNPNGVTMQYFFKPILYLGAWKLCLMDRQDEAKPE